MKTRTWEAGLKTRERKGLGTTKEVILRLRKNKVKRPQSKRKAGLNTLMLGVSEANLIWSTSVEIAESSEWEKVRSKALTWRCQGLGNNHIQTELRKGSQ